MIKLVNTDRVGVFLENKSVNALSSFIFAKNILILSNPFPLKNGNEISLITNETIK